MEGFFAGLGLSSLAELPLLFSQVLPLVGLFACHLRDQVFSQNCPVIGQLSQLLITAVQMNYRESWLLHSFRGGWSMKSSIECFAFSRTL